MRTVSTPFEIHPSLLHEAGQVSARGQTPLLGGAFIGIESCATEQERSIPNRHHCIGHVARPKRLELGESITLNVTITRASSKITSTSILL